MEASSAVLSDADYRKLTAKHLVKVGQYRFDVRGQKLTRDLVSYNLRE